MTQQVLGALEFRARLRAGREADLVALRGTRTDESGASRKWRGRRRGHRDRGGSSDSGGGFFEVSKKQTIDDVFNILEEELRSQYSLGYVSDVPIHLAEFRKIQLTVHQKGLVVQARDRYWAHH